MKNYLDLKTPALILCLFLIPSQVLANPSLLEKAGIVAPKTPKPAPDFKLKNIQGEMISFSKLLKNIHRPTQIDNVESVRMLANFELLSSSIVVIIL